MLGKELVKRVEKGKGRAAYVEEAPFLLRLQYQHGKGREEQRAEEAGCAELPCQLSFAGPGERPLHYSNRVEGGENVDDLEDAVVEELICAEDVGVSREEDEAIENLGDERDACKVEVLRQWLD